VEIVSVNYAAVVDSVVFVDEIVVDGVHVDEGESPVPVGTLLGRSYG
jgi:hypothetical protein